MSRHLAQGQYEYGTSIERLNIKFKRVTTMASMQEMNAVSVNSDGEAESTSGSSRNESSDRKRKENIRIWSPRSPFAKIVAVDEDVDEAGVGVGATEEQEVWEADGTDGKGSGRPGGESGREEEDAKAEEDTVLTEDGKKGRGE